MRVFAVDVGIRNLAFCVTDAGRLVAWQNVGLADDYKPSENVRYVMQFCKEHQDLLESSDMLVIERQMRVNMRIIESVLHALYYDKCTVVHARTVKARFGLCKRNYRQNKLAAVECVEAMLGPRRGDCPLVDAFFHARKKDDLADCYLMSIFFSDPSIGPPDLPPVLDESYVPQDPAVPSTLCPGTTMTAETKSTATTSGSTKVDQMAAETTGPPVEI